MRAAFFASLLCFTMLACSDPETEAPSPPATADATGASTEPAVTTPLPPLAQDHALGVWVVDMQTRRPSEIYTEELRDRMLPADILGAPLFTAGHNAIWITRQSTGEAIRYDLSGRETGRISDAWQVRESAQTDARWYRRIDGPPVAELDGKQFELPVGTRDGQLSPDGTQLALLVRLSETEFKSELLLIDLRTGEQQVLLPGLELIRTHLPGNGAVHWSPSGRYVFTYDWTMPSRALVFDLQSMAIYQHPATEAAWSPSSDVLLLRANRQLSLWDAQSGTTQHIADASDFTARFTADGQFVVWNEIGISDPEPPKAVYDVAAGREVVRWPRLPQQSLVGVSGTQPVLARGIGELSGCGTVLVHPRLPSEQCIGRALSGAWSPDGMLFVFSRPGASPSIPPGGTRSLPGYELVLFDVASGSQQVLGLIADVPTLDWDPAGRHLLVVWPQFGL